MIKILYLLAGICLKQTIDEIKAVVSEYVDYLKQYRESIQTYRPNPALLKGSPEAQRAINEHEHRGRVQPEVERLTHRIRLVRLIPLVVYAAITIGLLVFIAVLELRNPQP